MSKAVEEVTVDTTVEETVEEVIERPYSLRKLADADLFPLLQLLRKLGFKDIKNAVTKAIEESKNKNIFNPNDYETEKEKVNALKKMQDTASIEVLLDMADLLISKIDTHSDDIYAFFSNLAGESVEEIKKKEFGTLPLMIYDSFLEVKNTAFFKVLSKLL